MPFESPWVWLSLPPLILWVWWLSRRSYAQLSPRARTISTTLRLTILVLLLAALSAPAWLTRRASQHVVFLLDVSRSVTRDNLDAAMADIAALAESAAAKGHRVSVIAFGGAPRLLITAADRWSGWPDDARSFALYESSLVDARGRRTGLVSSGAPRADLEALDKRIADLESFRDTVAGDATDPRAALRLAMAAGDPGEAKTLYLFTDANFNAAADGAAAPWRDAFAAAKAAGHAIHTVALDRPGPPEVAAADLTLPAALRANQAFSADLRIASSVDTPARIAPFRDGYALPEIAVTLKRGENTVTIPGLYFRDKGFHTVEAAVRAEQDTRVENNRVKALAVVPGELRALYVDSDEPQASYLVGALALEGVRVETRPASGVPRSIDDLLGYDCLLLGNVPADKLTQDQMRMIRAYVQDFGGGFVMLGGDQSFGLGGYFNTPVEEVLPVRMPIQKDLTRPTLAIALVIDKSGSMEGAKMQLAKRAAIATADVINPRDQIGVIGFDGESRILLPLSPAADKAGIAAAIAELDAGGGTNLYPGLEDAHAELQASPARRKHVIVLSDGQTQGFGYEDLANAMAADGITISTVGVGEDADMKLMQAVAAAGGGRAYFTSDFTTIPQIFTREALRASNSMLVERLVMPTLEGHDDAVADLPDDLPPLGGYVATTLKETGKLLMMSDQGDPILATWRCGLGRSAAFTSDAKPRWAEDWIRWPEFGRFWAQLIRSVAGQGVDRDLSVEPRARASGDAVTLTAEVRDALDNPVSDRPLELMAHDPRTGATAVPVERTAPGVFTAVVPRTGYGATQQFAWRVPTSSAPSAAPAPPAPTKPASTPSDAHTVPFGFVQSFSPEYRTLGPSAETIDQIRAIGAGEILKLGEPRLTLTDRSSTRRVPLWPWLLTAALALVPLDILVRRLG